jgi:PAS domain S-box-containing protein
VKTNISHSETPEFYRLLVEQVKDYAIIMLDREGHVLSWNEGARRIKGYEAAEIVGKHFSTFYPQQDRDNQRPQFELRKAQEMGRYEEEGWRVRKDRSRFWANVVITPLRDDQGDLVGYAKVTRDLTQRKLEEDNLQNLLESEERFRLLVDQVKDYAIFILDARGSIASWNQGARRLKGYTSDEIIGQHFSVFYTEEDRARDHPEKELSIAIRDGRYEEEGWRVRKDGRRFWASVVITAVWDKRGSLTGFAKVTRDLTFRKKEEDLLRQKSRDLESFAHSLSHDLRTPLRSIASYAEILSMAENEMSAQERVGFARKICKASKTMDTLIKDVLKISEMSIAPHSDEAVSGDEVLDECIGILGSEIERTKAEIGVEKPLPMIKVQRSLLVQIFSNLLGNAIKFSRKGEAPRVKIFARQHAEGCEIHVQDFGIGIAEQYHESIFNMFERAHTDSATEGTGIGLAVVRRAVERVDGKVSVNSTLGEGSDFIVTMPCEWPETAVLAV